MNNMVQDDNNLANMVDSLVNGDTDEAEQSFHNYLKPKLQSTVQPTEDDSSTEDR